MILTLLYYGIYFCFFPERQTYALPHPIHKHTISQPTYICWSTFQMLTMASTGPGRNLELATHFKLTMWITWATTVVFQRLHQEETRINNWTQKLWWRIQAPKCSLSLGLLFMLIAIISSTGQHIPHVQVVLSSRTYSMHRNVLYLQYPAQQPLTTIIKQENG